MGTKIHAWQTQYCRLVDRGLQVRHRGARIQVPPYLSTVSGQSRSCSKVGGGPTIQGLGFDIPRPPRSLAYTGSTLKYQVSIAFAWHLIC